eukprot:6227006-Prymnesium_polylepis.5
MPSKACTPCPDLRGREARARTRHRAVLHSAGTTRMSGVTRGGSWRLSRLWSGRRASTNLCIRVRTDHRPPPSLQDNCLLCRKCE